jgi:hypothetical protein
MNKHERAALVRDQHALAAMASAEASALRLNATFATINTTIRTGATTFATDFVDSLVKGQTLMQSLQTAASALGKTLVDAGLKTLVTDGLNALSGPASSLANGVSQTASATSSATILTTAGTALAASMVSGATDAASILGIGGTTAGTNLGAGSTTAATVLGTTGVATGTEVATGGELAGTGLAVGGAAAGLALWGPIAALAAVTAGIALSLFANESNNRKTNDSFEHRPPAAAQTDSSVVGRGELSTGRPVDRNGLESVSGPIVAGRRSWSRAYIGPGPTRPAPGFGVSDLGLDGPIRRRRPALNGGSVRRHVAVGNDRIGTGWLVARARAARNVSDPVRRRATAGINAS